MNRFKKWSLQPMKLHFTPMYLILASFFALITLIDMMFTHLTYHFTPEIFVKHEMSEIVKSYFLEGDVVMFTVAMLVVMLGAYWYAQYLKNKYNGYPNAAYSAYVIVILSSLVKFFGAFTNYIHLMTL